MLINTVVLFLRDLLPIFLLLCLLKAYLAPNSFSAKVMLTLMLLSFIGMWLVFYWLPAISELYDGSGLELLQSLSIVISYIFLSMASFMAIYSSRFDKLHLILLLLGAAATFVIKGSLFIIFLEGYLTRNESNGVIFAGLTIGLGVCASFSALLYFFLEWLIKRGLNLIVFLFWALFLSGHLSQIIRLLAQVNIIESNEPLWDSNAFIKDSSEYGQLLNTTVGYEATPSELFLVTYLSSFFLFVVACYLIHRNRIAKTNPELGNIDHA